MTLSEFKQEIRLDRGRLSATRIDTALDYIYNNATVDFTKYMLRTKKLGIENAANIVDKLTNSEQTELVVWIETQPANISSSAIELKVEIIIKER